MRVWPEFPAEPHAKGWQLAVTSGILGWLLNAFDFFILIFLFDSIAAHYHVHKEAVVYPGVVSFTATGLPPDATATFAPATVAADAGPAPVNLSIQTASLLGMNRPGGNAASIALGLLLLPFLGAKRKRLLKGSGAADDTSS